MASFAMVLAGAPMFMWRWAIMCAAFINNISATFYKQINDPINSLVPFATNENKWSKHWWGVKVRMSQKNFRKLYGLNFHGLIG